MQKEYHVIFSKRADKNLSDIKQYLQDAADDELANTAVAYIMSQIHELEVFPHRFPIINPKNDLRRMPINRYTYNVFYKIEDKTVKIYHVRHQAQKPDFSV